MIEIKVPELAESITEGTISQWYKNEGDKVEQGEAVAEIETDKVNMDIHAEHEGVLTKLLKQVGDTVLVGEAIAQLSTEAETTPSTPEKQEASAPQPAAKEQAEPEVKEQAAGKASTPLASPAARKKAREMGIDLSTLSSRDPLGRIRPEDVVKPSPASKGAQQPASTPSPSPVAATPAEDRPVERIPMSRRRQTIATRLVEAQHNAAMLTTFNEVDLSAVIDIRQRRKEDFKEKHDVRLGFMSFFTKAVVGALKQFPLLNAEIQGNEMVVKKYYDIGIAVAAKEGLVVPVVRNADRLSFAEIEREIARLAQKAKENKLTLEDLQGGTFTITNGGVFGSLFSTPILNAPQVGILGMHTIQRRPVVVDENDKIEVRPMMYIALSYDHRIVDGKEAVSFLATVKRLVENPEDLLLEG